MNLLDLSLKEKIGQMFMVGVMDERHLSKVVLDYRVGGIIHFSRNGQSAKQAYDFFSKAKALSKYPLFRAIDQEGGIVTRVKEGLTPTSGNMAIAASGQPKYAKDIAEIMAYELMLVGANMNLAPVVDVNVNPKNPVIHVRSFGQDPDKVSAFSVEALRGYQNKGMLAVAKHFPGHGDTSKDSHFDLPVVDHDIERIHKVELKPFKAMIENGVDGIMVSHVLFKAMDGQRPATLSENVVTRLLRQELAYEGLIMTDCMEMHAISQNFKAEEAVVEAILAGADLILYSCQLEMQMACINAVYQAVENKIISEERIDASLGRIIKYKSKMMDDLRPWKDLAPLLRQDKHLEISMNIAKASITLRGDLPFNLRTCKQICTIESDLVKAEFPEAVSIQEFDPSNHAMILYKRLENLDPIKDKLDSKGLVLVALGSPYESFEGFSTLYTYELSKLSLKALRAVMEGQKPGGVLPVRKAL